MEVDTKTKDVQAMEAGWALADALLGGTEEMRAEKETHLPRWPLEEPEAYEARIAVSTLLPSFARTVRVMSAKPFAKELTLTKEVSDAMRKLLMNCDRQGNKLHTWASEAFPRVLSHGLHAALVDYNTMAKREPTDEEPNPPEPTMADAQAAGARPYLVGIECHRIYGIRKSTEGGIERLTQVRICEDQEVDDGDFDTALVERVRVLRIGGWRLYEKQGKGEAQRWVIIGDGTTTPIDDEIPLTFFYGIKEKLGRGKSPLKELAHLNVKHWQSQSDQDNILHFARVPLLVVTGGDPKNPVRVGGTATHLQVGETMAWCEHTGKAIDAGQTSLEALESQMLQIGAELLIKKPGATQRTATESNAEAEANKSDLQRLTEQFEASLDRCLGFMARFIGEEPAGNVQLYKEFGASTLTDASATLVKELALSGLIRKETALKEFQRRGILSPDLDVPEEVQLAEEEFVPPVPPAGAEPAANDPGAAAA